MKKLAILGPGVVGGSCAEILLRDAALLERNAGEKLELSYVLARRALPRATQCPMEKSRVLSRCHIECMTGRKIAPGPLAA